MLQHFYAGAHGQQVNAVTCLISNQPLAVVWLRVHKDEARLLREVICGAREVVKSVPVGFAFSVEHHCSCFSFFFLMSFYLDRINFWIQKTKLWLCVIPAIISV